MHQPGTGGDIHVNVPLTNISIAMMQSMDNFVSDKVFPTIPVAKQSDRYYTYDRGYFNRDEMEERAPGTESSGSGYTVDNTPTYYCPKYSFHHDIPDERVANADSVLAPDREAVELVTRKAMIKRERLWATKYFGGGIWATDYDGVAAAPGANQFLQWNDAASTPIEDMRAAKTTVLGLTGFEPNTLVMGQQVFDKLVDHPDIVDRVKYGQTPNGPALIEAPELAQLFKIPRVFVMKSIVNTGKEGQANAHSFIGGKKLLLAYAAPTPGLMTPTAGYTFSWTGLLGSGAMGGRIKKWYENRLSAERVEIDMSFDQKLVSNELGVMFDTAVA